MLEDGEHDARLLDARDDPHRAAAVRTHQRIDRDTLLFRLHEGTVVHLERSEEGWSLIRLSDGRRGWLRTESAERIAS